MVAMPLAARTQERVRRIGLLMSLAEDDPESTARLAAFTQGLQELGWTIGRNVRLDTYWSAGDVDSYRKHAAELVALAPDVLVGTNTSVVRAMRRMSHNLPIVFTSSVDPVGSGPVASLARPGGNVTGFAAFEFGTSGKWLELLKQIAPGVTRVAVLRASDTTGGAGQFGAIQAIAPSFGVELSPVDVNDADEIERTVNEFARRPNGGMIVVAGTLANVHRNQIVTLAAQHHLPAVYSHRFFVAGGGLISYGTDRVDPFRRAAGYVDRILKGEKPADLPVQTPTKYELAVNLKTAKVLGLTIPPALLAIADEVVE